MHDLRHAHASWLLAGGADLKTVMDRLGHARITTTQQYLHALADADDTALAAFRRTRDQHRLPEPEWELEPESEPPEYDPPGH
jgi:integrase